MNATFDITGKVVKPPRAFLAGKDGKLQGVTFTLAVDEYKPAYKDRNGNNIQPPARRSPFTLEAWTQEAKGAIHRAGIREGDMVRATGKLRNKPRVTQTGASFDNISFAVDAVEVLQDALAGNLPQQTDAQRAMERGQA